MKPLFASAAAVAASVVVTHAQTGLQDINTLIGALNSGWTIAQTEAALPNGRLGNAVYNGAYVTQTQGALAQACASRPALALTQYVRSLCTNYFGNTPDWRVNVSQTVKRTGTNFVVTLTHKNTDNAWRHYEIDPGFGDTPGQSSAFNLHNATLGPFQTVTYTIPDAPGATNRFANIRITDSATATLPAIMGLQPFTVYPATVPVNTDRGTYILNQTFYTTPHAVGEQSGRPVHTVTFPTPAPSAGEARLFVTFTNIAFSVKQPDGSFKPFKNYDTNGAPFLVDYTEVQTALNNLNWQIVDPKKSASWSVKMECGGATGIVSAFEDIPPNPR
jgi:hypothetical protein